MYLSNGPHPHLLEMIAVQNIDDYKALAAAMPICDVSWGDLILKRRADLEASGHIFTDVPVFSEAEMIIGFHGVLQGLQHAHSRGNAHLDLKPGNVLIFYEWDIGTTKIADFGLGMKIGSTLQGPCGTPGYMAPELCSVGKPDGAPFVIVSAAMDVYSVSMMFAEVMTGFTTAQIQQMASAGELQAKLPGSPRFAAAVCGGLKRYIVDRARLEDLLLASCEDLDRLNANPPPPAVQPVDPVVLATGSLPPGHPAPSPPQAALSDAVAIPSTALPPTLAPPHFLAALLAAVDVTVLRRRRHTWCGALRSNPFAAFAEAAPLQTPHIPHLPPLATAAQGPAPVAGPSICDTAAVIPAALFPEPIAASTRPVAPREPTGSSPITPCVEEDTPVTSLLQETPPACASPGSMWQIGASLCCSPRPPAVPAGQPTESAHRGSRPPLTEEADSQLTAGDGLTKAGNDKNGTGLLGSAGEEEPCFPRDEACGRDSEAVPVVGNGVCVGCWCALAVAAGVVGLVAARAVCRRH